MDRRLSLIDISYEDDSLLPVSCKNTTAPPPSQSVFPPSPSLKGGKIEGHLPSSDSRMQQDSKYCKEQKFHCSAILEEPLLLQENFGGYPNVKPFALELRRSKTTGHKSFRKSLAWDKAFLTGEGVLDLEELPIATKSSKKLLDMSNFELPDLNRNPLHDKLSMTYGSQSQSFTIEEHSNTMENKMKLPSNEGNCLDANSHFEDKAKSISTLATPCGSDSSLEQQVKAIPANAKEPSPYLAKNERPLSIPTSLSMLPKHATAKPPPLKNAIELAVQKGTRLRLPGSIAKAEKRTSVSPKLCGNEGPASVRKEPSTPTSAFRSKLTSITQRVKESLGNSLPGHSTQEISRATHEGLNVVVESNHVDACPAKLGAKGSLCMPSASNLNTVQTPRKEHDSVVMKFFHDSNKPKVKLVEDSKAKKPSGTGIAAPSLNAVMPTPSLKVEMPSKRNTAVQSCASVNSLDDASSCKNLHSKSEKLYGIVCNTTGASSGESYWRSKPSGLRMPSPKLGFFDSAKILTSTQHTAMPDRTSCLESEKYAQPQISEDAHSSSERKLKHFMNVKASVPSGCKSAKRFTEKSAAVSSGIPSAPHLRFSGNANPNHSSVSSALVPSKGQNSPSVRASSQASTLKVKVKVLPEIYEEASLQSTSLTEISTANESVSSGVKGLSFKNNEVDDSSDERITSNGQQRDSYTGPASESASFSGGGGKNVVKSFLFVHNTVEGSSEEARTDSASHLPATIAASFLPLAGADSLQLDRRRDCLSHSDLSEINDKSMSQFHNPFEGVRGELSADCSSNPIETLENKKSSEMCKEAVFERFNKQEQTDRDNRQKQEGMLPLEYGQHSFNLDAKEERCEVTSDHASYCATEATTYVDQDRRFVPEDSSQDSAWSLPEASGQKLDISSDHVTVINPSNTVADSLSQDGVNAPQHGPNHKSLLCANNQLLNVVNEDGCSEEAELDQATGLATSLESAKRTGAVEKNELSRDDTTCGSLHHNANKGKLFSEKNATKKVESKSLSKKSTAKENISTFMTPVLEDIPIFTGLVVHSPPNKISTPPGPWSPIRRTVQQLGPFDCTKYLNSGAVQKSQ